MFVNHCYRQDCIEATIKSFHPFYLIRAFTSGQNQSSCENIQTSSISCKSNSFSCETFCILWCSVVFQSCILWCTVVFQSSILWCTVVFQSSILWCTVVFQSCILWCTVVFQSCILWCTVVFQSCILWCTVVFQSSILWCHSRQESAGHKVRINCHICACQRTGHMVFEESKDSRTYINSL